MACVNTTAGILTLSVTDFVFPGFIPFSLDRSYRSNSEFEGKLGHGWGMNLGEEIRPDGDELVLHNAQGRTVRFPRPEPGGSVGNAVEGLELSLHDGTSVTIRQGNRRRLYTAAVAGDPLLLTRVEDAHGNAIRFLYHGTVITQVQDTVGRWFQLRYDQNARLTEVGLVTEDGEANLVRYTYDAQGDLSRVVKRSGAVNVYEYSDHLLVRHSNDTGVEHFYCYDEQRRCVRSWQSGGFYVRSYLYDHDRYQTLAVNGEGAGTLYRYNEFNLVTETINALGGISRFQYDDANNIVVAENQVGSTTLLGYDGKKVVSRTRADGSEDTIGYDEQGRMVERTNPLGGTSTATWNELGDLMASESPSGLRTTFEYDSRGATTAMVFPNGERVEREYAWNFIRFLHDGVPLYEQRFDLFGKLTSRTYRGEHRIEYRYDETGRRVEETGIGGAVRRFSYASNGKLGSVVDENGVVTAFEYNEVGLRTATTRGGATARFEYDREGRLVSVHNALGQVHRVEYNLLGRMVRQEFFDGRVERYEHDAAGAIRAITDASGKRIEYQPDALGRPIRVRHENGTVMEFEYSPTGRITLAIRDGVEVEFEYDEEDRLVYQRQDDLELHYAYGPQGKLQSVTDSDGRGVAWRWDGLLHPAGMTIHPAGSEPDRPAAFHAELTYDRMGALAAVRTSNGVTAERRNNGWRRPTWQRASLNGQPSLEERFEFDEGGKLIGRVEDSGRALRYEYDVQGRIEGVAVGDRWLERYAWDDLYNLTEKVVEVAGRPTHARFSYDGGGRLIGDGRRTFEYDGNGLLVRVVEDGRETRYWYTDDELLERVERPDGSTVEFRYDALRRRVWKKGVGGAETRYFWDQQTLWLERPAETEDDEGPRVAEVHYVFDPRSWAPLGLVHEGTPYLTLNDHLGTPGALLGPEGEVSWRREETIWGEGLAEDGSGRDVRCPLRFPGQYADRDQPLVYNLNRYYDPSTGRYTSPDPLGLVAGLNLYAYTIDPVNYTDPLGLECENFDQGEPTTLFRGDDRPPSNICANGFQPRNPSANISILDHVGGKTEGWVSTSYSMDMASDFASPGDRVYVIANPGCAENPGVEVDCDPDVLERQRWLQEDMGLEPETSEFEIAFKNVPPSAVVGYMEVGPNGSLGDFTSC